MADAAGSRVSTPTYRVGQQVAVQRGDRVWVGTIEGAQQIGAHWRYRVGFGPAWWEWVREAAIVGVQGELPLDG